MIWIKKIVSTSMQKTFPSVRESTLRKNDANKKRGVCTETEKTEFARARTRNGRTWSTAVQSKHKSQKTTVWPRNHRNNVKTIPGKKETEQRLQSSPCQPLQQSGVSLELSTMIYMSIMKSDPRDDTHVCPHGPRASDFLSIHVLAKQETV